MNDLFEPSLNKNDVAKPIYSLGALVVAAWLGGVFAPLFLGTINTARLGELKQRAPLFVGLFVASVVFYWASLSIIGDDNMSSVRTVNCGAGLLVAGGFYLFHKKTYRAMQVMGIDAPSPYVPVMATIAASVILKMVLMSFVGGRA